MRSGTPSCLTAHGQQFEFSGLKTLLLYLVIRGKLLHRDHHLWNGLVPLCPSYHWKHCIGARRLLCNQAKACPESRGIATASLVWRISVVMSISSRTTQCTRFYSNLTHKRLIVNVPMLLNVMINNRQCTCKAIIPNGSPSFSLSQFSESIKIIFKQVSWITLLQYKEKISAHISVLDNNRVGAA